MKYIAELNDKGIYNLRVVKEIVSSNCYLLDKKVVSDCLVILEDGTEFLYSAKSKNKLFDSLEACQEFIEGKNKI